MNKKIISYNDFLNESYDIDYRNDRYALVMVGGSIGNYPKYPILISGTIGSIIETSNDREYLMEERSQRNLRLSPGEKKYYGISYKLVELKPSVVKNIEKLIELQKKDIPDIEESFNSIVSESFKYNVEFDNEKESPAQILNTFKIIPSPIKPVAIEGDYGDNYTDIYIWLSDGSMYHCMYNYETFHTMKKFIIERTKPFKTEVKIDIVYYFHYVERYDSVAYACLLLIRDMFYQ